MGVGWTFLLSSILSLLFLPLLETAPYRLKYCLKGTLNPKQSINQSINHVAFSEDTQSAVIEAFNSTSRYLYDLLNIDNNFFDSMVNRTYHSELQLNKANMSDTETSFLDLHLSISDGFVKTKIVINGMILI